MPPAPDVRDSRFLILAPTGRDASLAATVLAQASLIGHVCQSIEELAGAIEAGAGATLIAEEALVQPGAWVLLEMLRRQPPWSDLPVLVLTTGGDTTQSSLNVLKLVEQLGNVALLERPVRVVTLLSAAHAALRARRRQYEVRDHLDALKRAKAEREELLARERAARAEVEAGNRAKDEFLAVLSHELRTPLQPILGWVKLLRQGHLDEATITRGLNTIERNAKVQGQLIEDLLDVSRIVAGRLSVQLHTVDLSAVIDLAIDAVRPAAEARSVSIKTNLEADVDVAGDPYRLQQIVWNLLSNAIAFTPEGGRIEIRLERRDANAVVSVRDTGRGIARQFLPHIFDRFRQADSTTTRRHGGLGLGLAIVRHLVEIHGGTIEAESAGEGHGATFTVTLPLLVDAVAESAPVPDPGRIGSWTPLPLSGLRLLVVEDDGDTADLLQTILTYYGAAVTAATSAAEALPLLERTRPDVLISDISMPGGDGYALVRTLRTLGAERGGRTPALALTAHARAADTEHAFLAGFQAHVAKPVEPAELAQIIARLAGRSG